MKRIIAMLSGAAALSAACLMSTSSIASAQAAASQTEQIYTTAMVQTEPLPTAGVLAGRLALTVSSDGLVNGWYTPEDAGSPVAVTGSERGGQLTLEIGNNGDLRVDATMSKDGRIVGTATEFPFFAASAESAIPPSFNFVATPAG